MRFANKPVRLKSMCDAYRVIPAMSLIRFASVLVVVLMAGCATVSEGPPGASMPSTTTPAAPSAPPAPKPYVEPPPPPVNLQGFPPTYRLGFGDGCATARGTEQKDTARFNADGNYRTGWQDGVAQCKKK
jgi:hypothetical protein